MMKLLADTAELFAPNSRIRVLRSLIHREELRVSRPLRSALPFLGLSICVGALTVMLALYTPCYELTVDGSQVGPVRNHKMVAQTVEEVEGQVSNILGKDYTLDVQMDYHLTIAAKDDLLSYSRLSDELYRTVPDIKEAYVLTVDGVYLGAAGDQAVLDGALSNIQKQYVTENTKDVYFANEARITRKYIPTSEAFSEGTQLVQAMTQTVTAETMYEVKPGDTASSVAAVHGMTKADLFSRNPSIAGSDALTAGQVIKVQKIVPRLSVCTVEHTSYTRSLASPMKEVKNNTMYQGDTKILLQGLEGKEQVQANVTHFNGEAYYEDVLSQKVVAEPTETVMAVGTKERPAYYSTGAIQWPCSGNITSPFGYRNIFGGSSFHSGIDIANSYGTSIQAADSGVVTYVGYKGTYGNLIIIDHGNGWETYYAHCAQTLVSEGEGVSKGSQIATMGASGRATGNHCHFEFHIGGTAVNPQQYLP
ncbi:MAG: Metalloendopeptidase [Evtepia sp.]|jgi:murein DD-endopeptidase MepM/ murein hydrolase activator NlpD|nr:Metalloendopeptidase [Evtepia sp.]